MTPCYEPLHSTSIPSLCAELDIWWKKTQVQEQLYNEWEGCYRELWEKTQEKRGLQQERS